MVVEGGMLGQQFMHNAGAPYKFILKTSTQPLNEAAEVIKEVMDFVKSRANLVVPCEFNEILSVAYMEGQRMEVIVDLNISDDSITMMESLEYTTLSLQ